MPQTSRENASHPPGPPGYFGLRNVARFATDSLTLLRESADRYGDVVRLLVLGKPWYLISHPDDIDAMLIKNARAMGRDEYVDVLQRTLGLGLLTSDGELWKRQRKLMAQAFTPKRIRSYGDAMSRVTDDTLRWRDGEELNLHDEMSRLTMAVAATVLFGAEVAPRDVELVHRSMEVVNGWYANTPEAILKVPEWVPTQRNRALTQAVKDIDGLIYRIISERRRGEERDDLLGTLLAAQDEGGVGMSDKQLRDEAVTLFLAGHETTALALAHTLYLLSKHPEIERRLADELERVLGGRLPTAGDIKALEYTGRVIKEGMRLYPPAWTTSRETLEDVELGGHRIPKGAQLLFSQWVVHRDPRWFPNPEAFDPDRWLPATAKALPRFAYFPFGGGPRVCIGNHFAMMEATLMLAIVVSRYRVHLLPGQTLELKPSVTLRPKGKGLRVRVFEREQLSRTEPAQAASTA